MRKFCQVIMVCLSFLLVSGQSVFAESAMFDKSRSYELADLMLMFMPDKGNEKMSLSWNISEQEGNIRWEQRVNNEPTEKVYRYSLNGSLGVLFSGTAVRKAVQESQGGEIAWRFRDLGFPAVVSICGQEYWNPAVVKIRLNMAPANIQKYMTGKSAEFKFEDYLALKNIKAILLWNHGNNNLGEKCWQVKADGKNKVWILQRTMQSASGVVGITELFIFYSQQEATDFSTVEQYY